MSARCILLPTLISYFNHANIIEYCKRPFRKPDGSVDVPNMNDTIIMNWNSRVKKGDTVYHLGDFGMGSWKEWAGFRERLNGRIILIKGNHDRRTESWMLRGDEVHDHLFVDGVYMAHVPPNHADYEKRDRKGHDLPVAHPVPEGTKLMLCGHVHDSWRAAVINGIPVLNVGVDVRYFSPVTMDELRGDLHHGL